jgi:hypothetical protein
MKKRVAAKCDQERLRNFEVITVMGPKNDICGLPESVGILCI